jgi:hypothetical protein
MGFYPPERDGKRISVNAQDENGKLLGLPGTYYLRYNKGGKQYPTRVGSFVEVPSAKLQLERHLSKVAVAEENDLPIPVLSGSGHSCQLALEGYLAARESKGESASGIGERRHDITLFLRFSGKAALEDITRQDLIGWRDHLLRTKAKNKDTFLTSRTVYNMMMTVSTWLKKNPILSVTRLLEQDDWPGYDEGDPLPYTEAEISKMLAIATPEESFIVRFGIGTGSRDGEAKHLEKSDIDFKRGIWFVRPKTVTTKGKRGMRTDKWSPKTKAGTRPIRTIRLRSLIGVARDFPPKFICLSSVNKAGFCQPIG